MANEVDAEAFARQRAELTASAQLRARSQAALTANAAYLAIVNPPAARVAAQVDALTRQVNALIRLELNDPTGTE